MARPDPSPSSPSSGDPWLRAFVEESNRIEGIRRRPTKAELKAHERLLALPRMSVQALEDFVFQIAPGHYLRRAEGMNVRVGRHVAMPGGYTVQVHLAHLVTRATDGDDPYRVHCDYEYLHPFTDGNGRSGRALWLWMMLRLTKGPWLWMVMDDDGRATGLRLGFLHAFYYQTLDALSDGHSKAKTMPSNVNGTNNNLHAELKGGKQ